MKKRVRFSEYHRFRTFDLTLPSNEMEKEKREKLHTKPSRECKVPEPAKKKKSPPKKKRSPQKKIHS